MRWTPSEEGDYLARAEAGDLEVFRLDEDGLPLSAAAVAVGIDRVEAVSDMTDRTLAALVSGGADLAIVRLAPGGELACAATLDLPGEVKQASSFFSRDLLVLSPDRVLVATSAGVFAVVVPDGCPMFPVPDLGFGGDALRGPMAAVMTPL